MIISQQNYDQKPLAIRHGALLLWGTLVDEYWTDNNFRQLYRFNDFLAQVCYSIDRQKVVCIYTSSAD